MKILPKVIPEWRRGLHFYTTWCHILGLVISGIGTGLALVYSSMDSVQHATIGVWQTYAIFFVIFLGALIGRFIKQ